MEDTEILYEVQSKVIKIAFPKFISRYRDHHCYLKKDNFKKWLKGIICNYFPSLKVYYIEKIGELIYLESVHKPTGWKKIPKYFHVLAVYYVHKKYDNARGYMLEIFYVLSDHKIPTIASYSQLMGWLGDNKSFFVSEGETLLPNKITEDSLGEIIKMIQETFELY